MAGCKFSFMFSLNKRPPSDPILSLVIVVLFFRVCFLIQFGIPLMLSSYMWLYPWSSRPKFCAYSHPLCIWPAPQISWSLILLLLHC